MLRAADQDLSRKQKDLEDRLQAVKDERDQIATARRELEYDFDQPEAPTPTPLQDPGEQEVPRNARVDFHRLGELSMEVLRQTQEPMYAGEIYDALVSRGVELHGNRGGRVSVQISKSLQKHFPEDIEVSRRFRGGGRISFLVFKAKESGLPTSTAVTAT